MMSWLLGTQSRRINDKVVLTLSWLSLQKFHVFAAAKSPRKVIKSSRNNIFAADYYSMQKKIYKIANVCSRLYPQLRHMKKKLLTFVWAKSHHKHSHIIKIVFATALICRKCWCFLIVRKINNSIWYLYEFWELCTYVYVDINSTQKSILKDQFLPFICSDFCSPQNLNLNFIFPPYICNGFFPPLMSFFFGPYPLGLPLMFA